MRVSGTIIERLFIRILPIAVLLGPIFYVMTSNEVLPFVKKWTAVVAMVWLFDSITLMSKSLKRLFIVGDKLRIGNDLIEVENLLSVNKKRDERRGMTIRTIELEYLNNGMLTKAQVITKPTLGDFLGRKTKTIDLLVNRFPSLANKIFGEV